MLNYVIIFFNKKTNGHITHDEYETMYNYILKYSYPCCLNYKYNVKYVDDKLDTNNNIEIFTESENKSDSKYDNRLVVDCAVNIYTKTSDKSEMKEEHNLKSEEIK